MRPFRCSSREPGVWAARPIPAGETIEEAPVVVLPAVQGRILAQTSLRPVLEEWPIGRGALALALGAIGLYRRSADANARLVKRAQETAVDVVATRDIDDGEEIVISEPPPSKLLEPHQFWSSLVVARVWHWGRLIRRRAETISIEELRGTITRQ
jgi:hypothetical protein